GLRERRLVDARLLEVHVGRRLELVGLRRLGGLRRGGRSGLGLLRGGLGLLELVLDLLLLVLDLLLHFLQRLVALRVLLLELLDLLLLRLERALHLLELLRCRRGILLVAASRVLGGPIGRDERERECQYRQSLHRLSSESKKLQCPLLPLLTTGMSRN